MYLATVNNAKMTIKISSPEDSIYDSLSDEIKREIGRLFSVIVE